MSSQTGLIPTISRRLSQHSILAQRAKDAEVLKKATEHAFKCRDALQRLALIVSEARLAESTKVSLELERLIKEAPEPLPHANIFIEIKVWLFEIRKSSPLTPFDSSNVSGCCTTTPKNVLATRMERL